MVIVKTDASSQNATWRGAAGPVRTAVGEWSRQSTQGWSGVRSGAWVVTIPVPASSCRGKAPYHFTIAHRRGPVCPAGGQPRYRLGGSGTHAPRAVRGKKKFNRSDRT